MSTDSAGERPAGRRFPPSRPFAASATDDLLLGHSAPAESGSAAAETGSAEDAPDEART